MYNTQYPIYGTGSTQPYRQTTQTNNLTGRPVASIDEARASIIDFDGSIFYFPDLANRRIYTKQINMDGSASLNMYELKEIPVEQPVNYVTREEFENVINQLRQSFMPMPQEAPAEEEPKVPPFKF